MIGPEEDILEGEWDDIDEDLLGTEGPEPVVTGSGLVRFGDPASGCAAIVHMPPFAIGRPKRFAEKEIERLWLTIHDHPWRSLTIVSTCDDDQDMTFDLAFAMADLGNSQRVRPHIVTDGRRISLASLHADIRLVRNYQETGARVIVAMNSLQSTPVVLPAARALDATVVCVTMGRSDIRAAREVVEKIGADRVLGAIVMRTVEKSDSTSWRKRKKNRT